MEASVSVTEEAEKVVVAVRAERVISRTALAWALTHVVRPGDCIALLAVFPDEKKDDFGIFRNWPETAVAVSGTSLPERIGQISESCSQMVLQFHNQIEVRVRIKVRSATTKGAVAAEAKRNGASWVILDKKLKQELRHCMDELRCNIVVMKGSQAKVLRLNLQCTDEVQTPFLSAAVSPDKDAEELSGHRMKHSTPVSSPEESGTSCSRSTREGLSSSSDLSTPLFLVYEKNPLFERLNWGNYTQVDNNLDDPLIYLDSQSERLITLSTHQKPSAPSNQNNVFWIPQNHILHEKSPRSKSYRSTTIGSYSLLDKFIQYDQEKVASKLKPNQSHQKDYIVSSRIRNAVSLGRTSSKPPPLCSLCQHKAPVFGKPPRQFSYEELVEATTGFSDINFLAEGGFGVVYRGVLRDGQVVAVKLLKFCGSQADADFCREVRVLSCAQHRNVVLLIGFCVDDKKRVLVYEYICNSSLDFHLHGSKGTRLDWHSRLRIAIGAARGLRYLHEDCRVGCIVHRDMRPNNILLTHDFEPLVTDFGLARWHSEWSTGSEERLIGTSGYLAPEYLDGGIITSKVDVYAFGVVLIEIMTGRRVSEMQLYKGPNFLSNWFHPMAALEPSHIFTNIYQLLDPFLASSKVLDNSHQLEAMCRAASLCLNQDPDSRPPMSKVLRILEGADMAPPLGLDLNSVGNRSARLAGLSSRMLPEASRRHSRKLSH